MMLRIGHGFDVHAFADGDYLTIGGVNIEYHQSFAAHSDGDVLLHAICDALLGAAALGDIGQHFPDTDPAFAGADSSMLLAHCLKLVRDKGYRVANVDSTIVAQAPKMSPHIAAMRENVARVLGVEVDAVNVKATTTERLGFEGRQEGVSAHAVILLETE